MISVKFYQIVPQSSIYYVRHLTSKSPKKEKEKKTKTKTKTFNIFVVENKN